MSDYDVPGLTDVPNRPNGKGDRIRGDKTARQNFADNYDAIFRKKKRKPRKKTK
jgi:hypothetical protein